jgi:malonyl-CoA O-methyltransferase
MNDENQFLKSDIKRSFNDAVGSYDEAAFLQREVADRLLERLNYIRLEPKVIVDLGSGTGYATKRLEGAYKKAQVIAVDFAEQMLLQSKKQRRWFDRKRYVCADAESLPFADQSVDLIFSSLMLQWCNDLELAFKEARRILKPNGLLLFSTLGPDTLYELKNSWSAADQSPHVHQFVDMHIIGDYLQKQGFKDSVVDMEFITLTYNEIKKILLDLKDLGTHNIAMRRIKSLIGKTKFSHFVAAYEHYRNAEGYLPVTYEVIYGIGWGPEVSLKPFEISIPLSTIKYRKK